MAESRGISPARADELAQGRVWTGGSARQLGLVDQFGGLDAALEWAAQEAGLEDGQWNERFLTSPPDPYAAMLAGALGGQASDRPQGLVSLSSLFARHEQQVAARVLADLDRLMAAPGVQALCLGCAPEIAAPLPTTHGNVAPWWSSLAARFLAH